MLHFTLTKMLYVWTGIYKTENITWRGITILHFIQHMDTTVLKYNLEKLRLTHDESVGGSQRIFKTYNK